MCCAVTFSLDFTLIPREYRSTKRVALRQGDILYSCLVILSVSPPFLSPSVRKTLTLYSMISPRYLVLYSLGIPISIVTDGPQVSLDRIFLLIIILVSGPS